jgi:hypothetical protein
MQVQRDWLSGGFVPAGGRGGFLPVIPTSARVPVACPSMPTGAASATASVGVRTPRFIGRRMKPGSPRNMLGGGSHRGYTPPSPTRGSRRATSVRNRASQLLCEHNHLGHTLESFAAAAPAKPSQTHKSTPRHKRRKAPSSSARKAPSSARKAPAPPQTRAMSPGTRLRSRVREVSNSWCSLGGAANLVFYKALRRCMPVPYQWGWSRSGPT